MPAASKEDFIRMYGNLSNVNLNVITIKYLGFFDVELSETSLEPNFYIRDLNLFFDSEKLGYQYLIGYFSQWTNRLRSAEHELYSDQYGN